MADQAVKRRGGARVPNIPRAVVERYLEFIAIGCERKDAAEMLSTRPQDIHRVINADPELRERFQEAWAAGAHEVLVPEAHRRAAEGWLEPVVQGGKHVLGHDGKPLYVRKYSDNLLMFSIKARLPEYKDSHHGGDTNVQVQVNVADRSAAVNDMWRVLAEAGIEASKQAQLGRGAAQPELPSAGDVLAEPVVVHGEASRVSRAPE